MDFFKDLTVTDIPHVSVVTFNTHSNPKMDDRESHGIALAIDGELIYKHGSKNIYLDKDHIVYLPIHSAYTIECTKAGSFALINFLVQNENTPDNFIRFKTNSADIFLGEHSAMQKLFISQFSQRRLALFSSFYKILYAIVSDMEQTNIAPPLRKAVEYIEGHINEPDLSNSKIAEHTSISEVYLRKLFSNNLHTSVKQYIQSLRIEKAKKLLISTPLSVTEISERCGYSGIYHFCRAFKIKTGCTPTEYKINNKTLLL